MADKNERLPVMQKVLDDPFLMLFLCVSAPIILFTIWGIMEIITIPLAK